MMRERKDTTTWFHGTSTGAAPAAGEFIDPSRAHFEPWIYATSSLETAERWAHSKAAEDGSEPVVIRFEPVSEIVYLDGYDEDQISTLESEGAGVIVVEDGEDGNPEMLVLKDCAVVAAR